MDKTTLLVDGDVMVYKATAAVEQEINWGDDLHTLHSNPDRAKEIIENQLHSWQERFDAHKVIIAFSHSHNFRMDVYPKYKSHRKGKRKPVAYKEVKEWVESLYKTYTIPNLEGDDVLGILSTSPTTRSQKIIVSVDKDFNTVPGYFWNPDKMGDKPKFIHPDEANYFHMYQTLIGDATDGYPGCPGMGPKTAEKLLANTTFDNVWSTIVSAYEHKGLTEEDALVQARCARILRYEDYDKANKEIKLWTP